MQIAVGQITEAQGAAQVERRAGVGLARVCRQARRQRGTRQRVGAHMYVMEEPLQVTP